MISVCVCGCAGKMGSATVATVEKADDLRLVCGVDPKGAHESFPVYTSLQEAIAHETFDVMVDFTRPDVVASNIACALPKGINCVIGTTGLSKEKLQSLAKDAKNDACLFVAPNFTTGAVLMMQFAKAAAPYFPEAEIIEFHHADKLDAPSGTAVQTAAMIQQSRGFDSKAPGRESEIKGAEGARGALVHGVPIHSVRSMGFVANQEVIFGSMGQTLSIKHESWDRESYMPGVLLGIRSVMERKGLIIGLENFMNL